MSALRRHYGASPLHLLAHLAAFALAGFAVLQLTGARAPLNVLFWFVGAVALHDALLWPLGAGLDRAAGVVALAADRGGARPAINFIRVPAGLAGALLLAYLPTILGKGSANLLRAGDAHGPDGAFGRWLIVTCLLFAGSGVVYFARARRAGRARR